MQRAILRLEKEVEVLQVSRPLADVFQIAVRRMISVQIQVFPVTLLSGEKKGDGW